MNSQDSSEQDLFARLTVDGQDLSAYDAEALFRRMHHANGGDPKDWCYALAETLSELIENSAMPATSSGTMGPPKRFLIPRADLVASARLTASTFGLSSGDRVLHCLPCGFIAGKMMLVRAIVLGLDSHFINPAGGVFNSLESRERFHFAAMIPLQLHRMLAEDRPRVAEQFRTILLGGGPVDNSLIETLADLYVEVFQSYGSTETVTHVAMRRLNGPQKSDHFTALGDVQFGRDPRGCLVIYTPHLSVGQHLTNDLVELLDDTHFRWLGRYDNVILSGGKKIHPEQLEAKIAGAIPYPHYFTAIADEVLGQTVMLVLETERPEAEVVPEVMEKVMSILHPHEWPRRVQVLERIERTGSGKVIRR